MININLKSNKLEKIVKLFKRFVKCTIKGYYDIEYYNTSLCIDNKDIVLINNRIVIILKNYFKEPLLDKKIYLPFKKCLDVLKNKTYIIQYDEEKDEVIDNGYYIIKTDYNKLYECNTRNDIRYKGIVEYDYRTFILYDTNINFNLLILDKVYSIINSLLGNNYKIEYKYKDDIEDGTFTTLFCEGVDYKIITTCLLHDKSRIDEYIFKDMKYEQ